jgi:hypothetical protein
VSGSITKSYFNWGGAALKWALEYSFMKRFKIIGQFLSFLAQSGKWWLMPLVMMLLLLGVVLVFAKGSVIAPFIYSLF